jgi:hypothetical protein
MGWFVPIEHAPFDSPISTFARDLREPLDQHTSRAAAAIFFVNKEILEEQQRLPEPGRVAAKEEGETDRIGSFLCDQTFEGRPRARPLGA